MAGRPGAPIDPALRDLARRTVVPGAQEPMGVYVCRSDDPAAELSLSVERTVFEEAFGNSPGLLAEEYQAYDPASVFICVMDQRRMVPAGMMRIIVPSQVGLKSLNDITGIWGEPFNDLFKRSGIPFRPDLTWDIATLAVAPEYRGVAQSGLVSIALYQTISMIARRLAIPEVVAILHEPVFRLVQRRLHQPFRVLGSVRPQEYLGSPASVPVHGDVPGWHKRLQVNDVVLFDIMHNAQGMEAAIRPPDWDAAVNCFEVTLEVNRARAETVGRSG